VQFSSWELASIHFLSLAAYADPLGILQSRGLGIFSDSAVMFWVDAGWA
jgi:hypothetical protein